MAANTSTFSSTTKLKSAHQKLKSSSSIEKWPRVNATLRRSVFALVLMIAPLLAQQEQNYKLNVDVDLTELHVTVTDDKDRTIANLARQDFHVFEDQTEQT